MIIKEITLEKFKSIYDRTTFTFDNNGLWKVSGPVGSGKTTIGEAILFCLYGSVKNKTINDLISWGANKCLAEIHMNTSGHDIIIRRIVKRQGQGDLDIIIDGTPLEYTDKRSGQQILESDYYDVPRVAVESLCVISFNNFKSIASMGPGSKESRQFIDDVFGFGIVNEYINHTKDIRDEKKNDILTLRAKIDIINKEIYNINKNLKESRDNIDTQEIINIEKCISDIRSEYAEKEAEYAQIIFTDQSKVKEEEMKCNDLKTRGKTLKSNIDKISGGVCPVCGSLVSADAIGSYNDELTSLREEYKKEERILKEAESVLKSHVSEWNSIKTDYQGRISTEQFKIRDIRTAMECEKSNYKSRLVSLNEQLKCINSDLSVKELDLTSWDELYNELYKNSRGILMRYYVDELNNNINFYLQEMQQPYVVKFTERFECKLSVFGEEDISINTLSTGQEKVVNTAIIFGILKTLLNGVNFNIIFLDELTSNMHDDLRDLTCDMIRRNIKGKNIYIISHAPIDDQLFDGEIKVKIYPREEDGKLIQSSLYKVEKH